VKGICVCAVEVMCKRRRFVSIVENVYRKEMFASSKSFAARILSAHSRVSASF